VSSFNKFIVLVCIYFSQGLPYGFFTKALPAIMRDMGASLPQIGIASFLALPWALKFLWAPLVDKYGSNRFGRKKTWILALQGIGVLLFLGLGLSPHFEGYAYLMVGFLVANLVAATQDIASDGLAVLLLDPSERGLGNGIQVAGYRLGMVFGGGFILMYFPVLHWKGSFLTIAAVLALVSLPLFKAREPQPKVDIEETSLVLILKNFFTRKGIWGWLFVICFYKFGDAMASAMLTPYLKDRGLTLGDIGRLEGLIGVSCGLAGAMIGGYLVRFLGRYRAVVCFGLFQASTVMCYFLFSRGLLPDGWLPFLIGVEYFSGGTATVAIFTVMMDICRPETGATDYTVQASLVVVTTILSGFIAGNLAGLFGYQINFLSSSLLCLLGVLLFAIRFRSAHAGKEFVL